MFEVRVHGRRGQGVVAVAELLAVAVAVEGRCAQAWPGFGAASAPGEIVAFCRLDDDETGTQVAVTEPDALIVQDPSLLDGSLALDGLRTDGYLLVNSQQKIENLPIPFPLSLRTMTVPATEIARRLAGGSTSVATLLGGFAALSGAVLLDSVLTATRQYFHGPAVKANVTAAVAAFGMVRTEMKDLAAANLFG